MFKVVLLFIFVSCSFYGQKGVSFYTSNGQLLDANGNVFLIRGVNNHHAWSGKKAFNSLSTIADYKANTVRIVWHTKGSAIQLKKIIEQVVKLKMIAIPEIHDATGKDSISALEAAAKYWARDDVKAILNQYKSYIILNIANEWMSSGNESNWMKGYSSSIKIIRNAGLTHCLLIDAAGWGQDVEPIKLHAKNLIKFDPEHNLLFSVHMYGSWNDTLKIKNELQHFADNKIPIIVGEFGYNANDGNNNLKCKVDAPFLMKTCHQLQVGYMAWSWCGNNIANKWLDMVNYNDWSTLTAWGETVLKSKYGILATAKKCTVFE